MDLCNCYTPTLYQVFYIVLSTTLSTDSFKAGFLFLNFVSGNFPEFLTNSHRWLTSGLLWKNGRELTSDLIELLVC